MCSNISKIPPGFRLSIQRRRRRSITVDGQAHKPPASIRRRRQSLHAAAYQGVGSAWTQFKWNSDALLETDDVIAPKPAFADLVARPGFLPGNFFEVFALLNGIPYEWIKGVN